MIGNRFSVYYIRQLLQQIKSNCNKIHQNLLDDKFAESKGMITNLRNEDYPIYVTRDLELAKSHVRNKYDDEPDKTFGLIASSKSKILPKYGMMNGYIATPSFTFLQYYVYDTHLSYCRNLNSVITEFACQGLELDMPILARIQIEL
ncbi:DUF2075 domain-containing protein [Flavobacterium sp. AC]|uniref:DUF2075 domain-containing protein n=1 Tax=Flavobacterium azizsancarii TaxID=2961580 RepID=A0ABT4WF50_9FLAO|nr:DNA/RNA helicase domain-containing protein [Flavobacterium azizsancarii]MDA6071097.1 DUF2075 domain-containing protein [Flavobacterium azizsancarii]